MEIPKLIILLSCIYLSYASHHHSHTIPVEGYEAELQNLGQHVEIPETPVKVIKITKTIAVKVPVPYPVKVIEKVPYPVHVAKPYPVPVTQIVHVPSHGHKLSSDEHSDQNSHQGNAQSYQVQEGPSHESSDGHSFAPAQEHSYSGGNSGNGQSVESFAEEYPSEEGSYGGGGGSSYDVPSHSYYGNGNNGNHEVAASLESQSYDLAIQNYLQKINPSSGGHGGGASGYHH